MPIRKWKTAHADFTLERFKDHKKDPETGWDWKAQRPQIVEYYNTVMQGNTDTPFNQPPFVGEDKFVTNFKNKAAFYKSLLLKDQDEHRRVPQDKTANQSEQEAPSPGEKENG